MNFLSCFTRGPSGWPGLWPSTSCALREASARFYSGATFTKPLVLLPQGSFMSQYEPWGLLIFLFFYEWFLMLTRTFSPNVSFSQGPPSSFLPQHILAGREAMGKHVLLWQGREVTYVCRQTYGTNAQEINSSNKSTPVAKTFIKTNEDLNCMEQCDQLAFFRLVDLFYFYICNYLNQCSSQPA